VRILYGIQATGNGHSARAKELIPELKKFAKIDVLTSGPGADINIGHPIKYKKTGIRLAYKNGQIDVVGSFKTADINQLLRDIYSLDLSKYDLVISDFEPITAWAANIQRVKSIGISHQYSFLSNKLKKELPFNLMFDFTTNFFALCDKTISLNYKSYGPDMYTPMIRKDLREAKVTEGNHITVYLWNEKNRDIVHTLRKFKDIKWEKFSGRVKKEKTKGNITFRKTENFGESLASSKGAIMGTGFTATAETLYLGKKLLTIPQTNNPEQEANAIQLEKMGIRVVRKIDKHFKKEIKDWLENYYPVKIKYPDIAPKIVKDIIRFAKEK